MGKMSMDSTDSSGECDSMEDEMYSETTASQSSLEVHKAESFLEGQDIKDEIELLSKCENASMDGVITHDNAATADSTATNLRSSANDAVAMKLVRSYAMRCQKAEEYALDYVMELHHPVISCFREIRKGDLNTVFNTSKWKRHISDPVEQSVVYVGLIDYIATVLNNPLYDEHFSTSFTKGGGLRFVQKLMMDFKNMIGNWSLSDKDCIKKRYEAIMSHLRQLVPLFAAAGQDFEGVLDCIEGDIVRIKANQERIKTSFPEDAKDNSKTIASESVTDDRFALGEIVLNFGLGDKTKTPISPALNSTPTSAKSKAKVQPLSKSTKSPSTGNKKSTPKAKTPSSLSNPNKRPKADFNSPEGEGPTKKIKISDDSTKTKPSTKLTENDATKCGSPKKAVKIDNLSLVNGEMKVNAFAFLMNKSREMAKANKLKKIAAEEKIAAKTVV